MRGGGSGWHRLHEVADARYRPALAALLVLGVLLRVAAIAATTSPREPLNSLYPGFTDGEEYMDNASSLLHEGVYGYAGRPSAFRPPAYPLLLAFLWRLFGETLTAVRLVQVALAVAMILAYARIVKSSFGPVAALTCSLIMAGYPLFVFITTEIATESLYMALSAWVFALGLSLARPDPPARRPLLLAWVTGLCAGLGVLTRPNMLAVLALMICGLLWERHRAHADPLQTLRMLSVLGAGVLVVVGPWVARNALVLGAPVLTTNIQYNLFRGTFDLVRGIPGARPIDAIFREQHVMYEEEIEDARRRVVSQSEIENERNARAAAAAFIHAHPREWLIERGRNALYLWLNLQWDQDILHRSTLVRLAALGTTLAYLFLLLGGLAGTALGLLHRRERPRGSTLVLWAWLFIIAAMSVVVTFVGKRYRVSMIDPNLALLTGVAVTMLVRRGGPRVTDAPAPAARNPPPRTDP